MKILSLIIFLAASSALATSINTTKTLVDFLAIGKPSAIKIRGKSEKLHSELQYKDKTLGGRFVFDLDSLDTGIETRDQHMKEKYLETAKFKNAELSLKPLPLSQDLCKEKVHLEKMAFEGTFKLHGVENPVRGEFDVKAENGQGHSQVRFEILISDYKIEIPTYMGIKVADLVKENIELDWSCQK